jgi:hypothetical protein
MAQELINIGVTADDGTGDTIRGAGIKINNNFTEVYARPLLTLSQLSFDGNVISATQSNADIELAGNGTGNVQISDLTIDSVINISDNEIKVNDSNADLLITANGTGSVLVSSADVNNGTVDNTVIGGTTPLAGTYTALTVNTSAAMDGVTITDNTISTNSSNANLEILATGTGAVSINGIKLPTSDGSANQVLQTDGSGQLSFFTSPILFDNTDITDGTATLNGDSSTQTIDSFDASTFRSAKYHVQISDTTADRYKLEEVNVTHDGSTAYISITGGASNGAGDGSSIYDSMDISADVSGGNVRLRGTVNNTNTQVVKFVRRILKV